VRGAHRQESLFGGRRMQMDESIAMTIASVVEYGQRHRHWAIAWSGGKDSTTLLTLVVYLILAGKVPAPQTLTVLYADTRLELVPLWDAARAIRDELAEHADALAAVGTRLDVRVVMAPLDERFLVYMLGRGVPPPNNNTLRWCTAQIKIEPMARALEAVAIELGLGAMVRVEKKVNGRLEARDVYRGHGAEKLLVLTGVRQGESAVRDGRIALSCTRDGGECGQGWYQEDLPDALCDTLAPILHWRICHVWEWLCHWATQVAFGDWTGTKLIALAYGGRDGDEASEIGARTGCTGCPLAEEDTALDAILKLVEWAYLAPLKELRPLWRELRLPRNRLRKPGGETRKDGTLVKNQQRMGPLVFEARLRALDLVLDIQRRVNTAADRQERPRVDLINAEEEARIRELIAAETWPNKWTGEEPTADVMLDQYNADGSIQPLLFEALRGTR